MKSWIGCVLPALAAALVLAFAPAAAAGIDPGDIVTPSPCCGGGGFSVQTLDGTVVGSVAFPAGADPVTFAPAVNGSIVYDDASQGTGDAGPVWLVSPNHAPTELDASPDDFDASISSDGSKVVFARYDPITGASDIYVVDADGSSLTLVGEGEGDNYLSSPEFSPDGGSIAYACRAATEGFGVSLGCGPTMEGTYRASGVMLMGADGSNKRMILAGAGSAAEPIDSLSWSPDGQWLALVGCVETSVDGVISCDPRQVFVYRTDGSDLFNPVDPSRQVTHEATAEPFSAAFSADGSQLLFLKVVGDQSVLYGVKRDGTNEHQLFPAPNFEVVPPAAGGGPPPTVNVIGSSTAAAGAELVIPSWIPQCHGFIFVAQDRAYDGCTPMPVGTEAAVYGAAANRSVVFGDVEHGTGADGGPVWLVRHGHPAVELDSSPYDFDPSISDDGLKVAFARFDPTTGASSIYVLNSDGSGRKLAAAGQGIDMLEYPTFSPDGRSIAYECGAALPPNSAVPSTARCGPSVGGNYGTRGVMLMNADGSAKRLILASQGGRLSWSPDGKWLTTTNCIPRVDGATVTPCDTQQLFAYRTDGSDLFNGLDPSRQITHNGPLVGPIEPQFSPDGGRILFLRADAAGEDPYLINRDGSGQHEVFLTPDPDPCTNTFMPFCNPAPSWGLYVPPAVGGGPSPTVRPRQATVPNVRALRYRTAKTRLAAVRLHAKVTHRRYSSRIKRGRVISQFPHARARASLKKKRSRVVKLVLSRGKRPKAKKH